MKINFYLTSASLKIFGGYKTVYEYSNYLINHGHDVFIYYDENHGNKKNGMRSHLFILIRNIFMKIGYPFWFNLNKNVKQKSIHNISETSIRNADVSIATAVRTSYPVYALSKEKGKKFYFIQGYENWSIDSRIVKNSYKLGMTNIVVSKWLKNKVDLISDNSSILVSNCINTNIFYDKSIKRKKHSIVLQYREEECKGPKYTIEVINKVKALYPDLHVDIITTEKNTNNLPKYSVLHKNVKPEKVAQINNECEVFICTSISEGFGLPGLEAMACGCVVISTNYEGILDYALNGKNALLSPIRDVDAMVQNIKKVFEDEELRRKIVYYGIETSKSRSLANAARDFENILKS